MIPTTPIGSRAYTTIGAGDQAPAAGKLQPDLWHKDRTDCDVIVSEDLPGIGRGSGRGNSNAIAGGGTGQLEIDAIRSARSTYWMVMNGKHHGIALPKGNHRGA